MLTANQMREKLLTACKESGSLKEWCRANGLRSTAVYQFLGGGNPPSKVVAALGFVPVTVYVSAETTDNVLRDGDVTAEEPQNSCEICEAYINRDRKITHAEPIKECRDCEHRPCRECGTSVGADAVGQLCADCAAEELR